MGAQAVDYRISKVVVCCKDCGQDVGLYPARHKCQDVIRPPLPPLPTAFGDDLRVPKKLGSPSDNDNRSRSTSATSTSSSSFTNSNNLSDTSSVTSTGSKWALFGRSNPATSAPTSSNNQSTGDENEESIYFNNFAAHLPEGDPSSTGVGGKKLWGKVRQNDKWKQLSEKYEKPKQSTKLWGKLVQATQNMAEKMPARDDHGPDSDESDWEGESHVSRILREYYQRKHEPLPHWLFDEHTPAQAKTPAMSRHNPDPQQDDLDPAEHSRSLRGRKQRLWESSEPKMTQREREREELRQQRQAHNISLANARDPPEERGRYNRSYSDENPRYGRSGGRYDDQFQRSPAGNGGVRYEDHQQSPPGNSRYDDYHRSPSNGGRYDDYQRSPPSGTNRYDNYQRSRYSGYEEDGDSSRPYLSERRVPPMRSRSPARPYEDDIVSDYFSENQRYDDRPRGPREIPPSHSRRMERAGGYF
ncbi:hypothetical protein BX666DRAFT_1958390 [Dichotomocladium elegans]|nr:hypothetical protein BX666DRAFT_1958390 [Dichotomocladium elegans]